MNSNPAFSRNPAFRPGQVSRAELERMYGNGGTATATPVDASDLEEAYSIPAATGAQTGRMTVEDTVVKTIMVFAILVASAVADGANIAPRCNGVMFASSPPPRTASFTLSNLRVGSFIQNGAAGQWSGSFAEVVLFPDALPVVDRLALERDMGAFYGVVVQ